MGDLDNLLAQAAAHEMTPAERDQQRLSWVYGQLPDSDTRSKAEVAASLGIPFQQEDHTNG